MIDTRTIHFPYGNIPMAWYNGVHSFDNIYFHTENWVLWGDCFSTEIYSLRENNQDTSLARRLRVSCAIQDESSLTRRFSAVNSNLQLVRTLVQSILSTCCIINHWTKVPVFLGVTFTALKRRVNDYSMPVMQEALKRCVNDYTVCVMQETLKCCERCPHISQTLVQFCESISMHKFLMFFHKTFLPVMLFLILNISFYGLHLRFAD